MNEVAAPESLIELTVDVVSAYVANNSVRKEDLVGLIGAIHGALTDLAKPAAEEKATPQEPAVPVKKSVTPDLIICLEDGKGFKSLKRHLRTAYGLTPEAYRAKWNLPSNYPMVAPNYAAFRSAHAKAMHLGEERRMNRAAPAREPEAVAPAASAPRKLGALRKKSG